MTYSLITGRTVKITEEAYQALSHRVEESGMSRTEYLSKLITSPPLEEPKGTITAESPKKPETEPTSLEERYPDLIGMFGRERNRYLYNLFLDGKISKEEMERNKG